MKMKRNLLLLASVFFALSTFGQAWSQPVSSVEDLSKPAGNEPPMLGIHWVRGFEPNYLVRKGQKSGKPFGGGGSPDMTNHGGLVLTSPPTVQLIFWGNTWSDPNFTLDKISGMDSWYGGFSGSTYATTTDEYTGGVGSSGISYKAKTNSYVVDTSTAKGGNRTSAILAEVCKVITNPVPNGYYPVYVDLKRNGSYCAYHSWGSCNGIPIEFGFFWNLDGDSGCDPKSTVSGETQGLAALANVSGHELAETITDPTGSGWYDSGGSENGDKCVWTFNVPSVTFADGTPWKIQGEWSNASYDAKPKFGYPNSAGQNGCLDGDALDESNGKSGP